MKKKSPQEKKEEAVVIAGKHADAILEKYGPILGTAIGVVIVDLVKAARLTGEPTKAMRMIVNQLEEVVSTAEKNNWES